MAANEERPGDKAPTCLSPPGWRAARPQRDEIRHATQKRHGPAAAVCSVRRPLCVEVVVLWLRVLGPEHQVLRSAVEITKRVVRCDFDVVQHEMLFDNPATLGRSGSTKPDTGSVIGLFQRRPQ